MGRKLIYLVISHFIVLCVFFTVQDKTPMPDGILEYHACLFCDPTLKQYVALHHAQMRVKTHSAGRGRGRGRRGRGRGRGGRRGR